MLTIKFSKKDLPDYWVDPITELNHLGEFLRVIYETPLYPMLQDKEISYEKAYQYSLLRKEFGRVCAEIAKVTLEFDKLPDFNMSVETAQFILPLLKSATYDPNTCDLRILFIEKLEAELNNPVT